MLKFFDAHTHTNLAAFKSDYKEVVGRALSAGVGMVNVGTEKDTSLRAIEIAREFANEPVFAAVGLHPVHTDKSFHDANELEGSEAALELANRGEKFDYAYYRELALDPKTVAIGECGLDYFHIEGDVEGKKAKQKEALIVQMKLSKDVKKPLMIHCRNAFPDIIELFGRNKELLNDKPGIIHFFSGTKDEASRFLELGFYFTFGGVVTFVRDYDGVIGLIPMNRILSETDAPYVAPVPYRGKRNEPAYVAETAKKLAELKSVSIESIMEQILKNTSECFNLKLTR